MEMANRVPLTLEGAKRLNLKPVEEDDVRPEGGVEFDAEKDGDICYMSPCINGGRYIYYWVDGRCVFGFVQLC
jgi:hypothetical protein